MTLLMIKKGGSKTAFFMRKENLCRMQTAADLLRYTNSSITQPGCDQVIQYRIN